MASILDEYRRHATDHGAFLEQGNAAKTNRAYDCLQNAFRALIDNNSGNELFSLYDDQDLHVQCWAAAHTLEIDEPRALEKLRELEVSEHPHVSMDAHYVTQEWKIGALRFLR